MKYNFYHQQHNCCIPCCIQSILDRRGFRVPKQRDIARQLNKTEKGVFIHRDLSPLKQFFSLYSLDFEFYRPYNEVIEADVVLQEELQRDSDVMIGFIYNQLYLGCNFNQSHFALVESFNQGDVSGEIQVHDNQRARIEQIRYSDLIKSMKDNEECGFYIIR